MTALDSMTGVLPIVVVAGAATMITKSMFGATRPEPRRRKSRRSKQTQRRPSLFSGIGDFSNLGPMGR